MLPELVKISLIEHLKCVRRIHQLDIKEGFGQVNVPIALSRKYPNASREKVTEKEFNDLKKIYEWLQKKLVNN